MCCRSDRYRLLICDFVSVHSLNGDAGCNGTLCVVLWTAWSEWWRHGEEAPGPDTVVAFAFVFAFLYYKTLGFLPVGCSSMCALLLFVVNL